MSTSTALVQGLPRTVLTVHRAALLVWGAFVAGTIGWLVWLNEVTAERAHASASPFAALDYSDPTGWIAALVCYSFLAVAAFAGASLVGRELESGTARLAWTQGVSPTRWLTAKLAVPAAALTLGGTALVLAYRWGWAAHRDLMRDKWSYADVFVARGPATVAYALCALSVGALTALLVGRTLPALGVSFAAMWLLHLLLEAARPHLWPAVTRTSPHPVALPRDAYLLRAGGNGERYVATYHPQSHFWPLHLLETGIVLTVTAAVTAAAFTVLRRGTA
ncbi:hypothetical protein [Streptomyces sp. NPDC021356]|uniref:hypothetical protein n=1 Tax=Streptomyces sp. NPDC021356 TaxID=3154900 RepID=UPI0033E85FF3